MKKRYLNKYIIFFFVIMICFLFYNSYRYFEHQKEIKESDIVEEETVISELIDGEWIEQEKWITKIDKNQ